MTLSLQQLCIQKFIDNIKTLPPVLKDEILGQTRKEIEKDIKDKLLIELEHQIPYMIENFVIKKIDEINGINNTQDIYSNVYTNKNKHLTRIAKESADHIINIIEPIITDHIMNTKHNIYIMNDDSEHDSDNNSDYEDNY